MKHLAAYALTLVMVAALPLTASGQGIPIGSTKVGGPPDSAFSSFMTFMKKQGNPVIRVDSARQRVEATVEGTDEPILFIFRAQGDSTSISAQGTKGGMTAMILGLGVVKDWLDDRRAIATPAPKP